jgi:hypothetical protein
MKYLVIVCLIGIAFLGIASAANYAVIIEGSTVKMFEGKAPANVHYGERWGFDEFWTDCAYIYDLLRSQGVPEENIWALWGDGSQWGVGQPSIPERFWIPFVDMACTRKNLDSICSHLTHVLTSEDMLIVYTFDHGGSHGNNVSFLCLYDDNIDDTTFARLFDAIPYRYRIFWMQQCFSGGFIDNLENKSTIILTSTGADNVAWRADDVEYPNGPQIPGFENQIYVNPPDTFIVNHGEWNTHLLTSFSGGWLPSLYYPDPVFRDSIDQNHDGRISLLETNNWILYRDSRPENPQFSDLGNLAERFYIWPTIQVLGVAEERKSITHSEFIRVYPNPSFQGRINFSIPDNQSLIEIKIFDTSGRLVIQTNQSSILLKTSGIYFYQIKKSGTEIQRGKIVVVK